LKVPTPPNLLRAAEHGNVTSNLPQFFHAQTDRPIVPTEFYGHMSDMTIITCGIITCGKAAETYSPVALSLINVSAYWPLSAYWPAIVLDK